MTQKISNLHLKSFSEKVASFVVHGSIEKAYQNLQFLLNIKCSFVKLDLLGREIGRICRFQPQKLFQFCDSLIESQAMGGFVIVASGLIELLSTNLDQVMQKSREYIIKGDKWYVCDIIGERSLGFALINHFEQTLPWFIRFLQDENEWVVRSVGVAIHFFSKRVQDEPEKTKTLLKLIEPYMEVEQIDVVKGLGWGLKTIGKYHPDLLTAFLEKQWQSGKRISKLMIKKALTYLSEDEKERFWKEYLS